MATFFNFLLIAGAFQGFVFNIATFLSRKKIEKPIIFLNLFVFVLSMNNLQSWLIDNGYVAPLFFLKHFIIPWYVLIVPMFFAFVRSYMGVEDKKWSFLKLSFFIFVLEFLARSFFLVFVEQKMLRFESIVTYNAIEDILTLGYSLFMFYKVTSLIYSNDKYNIPILNFDDLNWLKLFIKLGAGVMLLWIVSVLLNNFSDSIQPPYNYYPLRLGSSVLIYWIGYQGFFRYVVLKDRIALRKTMQTEVIMANKPLQTVDKINKDEAIFNNINTQIILTQQYLDSQFSLEKLAKELDMGITKLSALINRYGHANFSDYLNSFRVEKAKLLLQDDDYAPYTIVAIGLECGFNSKSTFYTAFKKFTGKTPSDYRKNPF